MASSSTQLRGRRISPERWQEIKGIFDAALNHAPSERSTFLDEACRADDSLRHQIEVLLASHLDAEDFLETPAAGEVAKLIVGQYLFSAGQSIGHYEVISTLGAGGMGEVYRARDIRLAREVAIKVLPRLSRPDSDLLLRFEQEAFTASGLNHPNILTVYEFGEIDSQPFIATEYVDGVTLRHYMKRSRLTVREALEIATQLASALVAAHRAGVVHRDIKPENIMIRDEDGIVKVLDFGLAKATERSNRPWAGNLDEATRVKVNTSPGVVMGTANYMSPEQARGLAVDERTDIWSLGVVLYEMIAGRLPFDGLTTSDVVSMILQKEPSALTRLSSETNERLDEIVGKALAKDREERYQVAKDLLIDLKRLKQNLDFAAEIDRTSAPVLQSARGVESASGQVGGQFAVQTDVVSDAVPTRASSAEYIVTEIKRHKVGAGLAVAGVVALIILAIMTFSWLSRSAPPSLTDKDTIVLADFANTTGDQVFDGTLKQALAVQLGQTPFLNILSDERVHDALRLMGRPPEERVSREIGREICQRQGLKALFAGSISGMGSHYVISLELVNAQSGDTIAREQVEAASKEQVLTKLGEAARNLREKLGESLASIKKFDAPVDQATTSSLEALKAYSLGYELYLKGKHAEAIPLYKRAIDLDPNFARAYSSLALEYSGFTLQEELATAAAQKAFDLRERTSEFEKLKIAADYYTIATGETDKAIEALQSLTVMYPRNDEALSALGTAYMQNGQFEKAIDQFQEAIRLNPNVQGYYGSLSDSLRDLNRFDEAKQTFAQAQARGFDLPYFHTHLYFIAFAQGDEPAMQTQIDWLKQENNQYEVVGLQATTAWFRGQAHEGGKLWNQNADFQLGSKRGELAGSLISSNAWRAAVFGLCRQARQDIARASTLPTISHSLLRFGIAHALCGDVAKAQFLADENTKRYPRNKLISTVEVPIALAAIEIRRGRSQNAIRFLEAARLYDRAGFASVTYWPQYLRGQAYLDLHQGVEAESEFQKILDRRGLGPAEPLYPLAYVGLARAAVLMGDTAKARRAYESFFAMWKDADRDIPILIEAKKEYERLK